MKLGISLLIRELSICLPNEMLAHKVLPLNLFLGQLCQEWAHLFCVYVCVREGNSTFLKKTFKCIIILESGYTLDFAYVKSQINFCYIVLT